MVQYRQMGVVVCMCVCVSECVSVGGCGGCGVLQMGFWVSRVVFQDQFCLTFSKKGHQFLANPLWEHVTDFNFLRYFLHTNTHTSTYSKFCGYNSLFIDSYILLDLSICVCDCSDSEIKFHRLLQVFVLHLFTFLPSLFLIYPSLPPCILSPGPGRYI